MCCLFIQGIESLVVWMVAMVTVTQKQCLGHREEFNHIVFMCTCIFTPLLNSREKQCQPLEDSVMLADNQGELTNL